MLSEVQKLSGNVPVPGGAYNEMQVSDRMAKYYNMVRSGNVFYAATPAAVTISLAGTAATGFILSNPNGSGKNLVLLELLIHAGAEPAAVAPFVLTGSATAVAVTHTTPLSIFNALYTGVASGASVAKADSSSTIPTPAVQRIVPGGAAFVGTAASAPWGPIIHDNIDGLLVLAPGTVCALQTLTTALLTSLIQMTWAEEIA